LHGSLRFGKSDVILAVIQSVTEHLAMRTFWICMLRKVSAK